MRHFSWTLTGFSLVFLFFGCSSSESDQALPADDGGVGGAGGKDAGHTGGSSIQDSGIDSFFFDAITGDATPLVFGCSADLQNVVDGDGNVIKECAPHLGCSEGKCVPACEAAANSKGNVGCDFVIPTPSFYPSITQPCFAVFLANNWPGPVQINVSLDGQTFVTSQFARIPTSDPNPSTWQPVPESGLPQGEVAVLFLSSHPSSSNGGLSMTCPVPSALSSATSVPATGRGQAWHITTDAPVSAYDIHPYGGAKSFLPSAEMLLPTSAWGTNYVAVVPKLGKSGPQYGTIVAREDDTTVTVLPNVNLPSGNNVVGAPINVPTQYLLQSNEFVQWQPSGEMTGTIISADKPIAFTGGNGYLCLSGATSGGGGCDSGHQAIPPVSAFGYRYVGMPYATRRASMEPESVLYRIVGAVEDTMLSFDPPQPQAPASLTVGQMVDFEVVGPFIVESQDEDHPFYLGQMMTGCNVTGGSRPGVASGSNACLGDEEYVNILPPAQFLSRYVFFTDPTYATTNLVIARAKTPTGFQDVSLACSGIVSGWEPIGSTGEFEIANVDLVRSGQGVSGCANGPHTATSEGPFGLMVWGLDSFSSYAYPAGGNITPINTVIVPPIPK